MLKITTPSKTLLITPLIEILKDRNSFIWSINVTFMRSINLYLSKARNLWYSIFLLLDRGIFKSLDLSTKNDDVIDQNKDLLNYKVIKVKQQVFSYLFLV